MDLYPVAVCNIARQDNTIQYNTIRYNTIQYNNTPHEIMYNTQNNPLYAKLQNNKEHILYPIKAQKRVETEVDGIKNHSVY